MAGQRPDDRAAPVVTDPDGFVAPERVEQVDHVAHDVLERVVLVAPVHAGTAVAPHVGRDGAEAEIGEARQLVPPAD